MSTEERSPCAGAHGDDPLCWSIERLTGAYAEGNLSPVEVTEAALTRIASADGALHAFVTVTAELARSQAADAERAYRHGARAPLLGVPVSVKDSFHVADVVTTFGSLVHREHRALEDSSVVQRLRAAGAVVVGKTNMAEFGQSATTDNRLGPPTTNPWDPRLTAGGSSGGAAASVAGGMVVAALGSDGGGSIRIPAAFTGLFGFKPTSASCRDQGGLRAMTPFSAPGPLARRARDGRVMLTVLAGRDHSRGPDRAPLRLAWCPRPEGRPVARDVASAARGAVERIERLGHDVEEVDLPLAGWQNAFDPLVLAEEHRERGPLLEQLAALLTPYERATLSAARRLEPAAVVEARRNLLEYRTRLRALFDHYDYLLTPTTAVTAFPADRRPRAIDGEQVDTLWGAFPFCVPFNVADLPAVSVPCGLGESGLPVGLQVVGRPDGEAGLLDFCEAIEATVNTASSPTESP